MINTNNNLPPGVNVTMLPGWDEIPPTHCASCGAFISRNPTRRIVHNTEEYCDGKVREIDEPYDDRTWEIVKSVTDSRTYKITWTPCSDQWSKHVEEHKPHWFEAWADVEYQVWCKKCGKYTTVDAEGYSLR